MGATGDLFDGLAATLQTAGVGVYLTDVTAVYQASDTAIVRSKLPATPDRAVALRIMRAAADVSSPFSTFLVQTLIRGLPNNPDDATTLLDDVTGALLGLTHVAFGATHVAQVRFAGANDLDDDESMRALWSSKFLADVDEPPTSLRPAGGWD